MNTFKKKSYVYQVKLKRYDGFNMGFFFSSQKNALDYLDAEYDVYKVVKTKSYAVAKDRNMDVIAQVIRQTVWGI